MGEEAKQIEGKLKPPSGAFETRPALAEQNMWGQQ